METREEEKERTQMKV